MLIRIYYEDTDAGGVVYNASYLRFFERARTEWLRERGVDLKEWMDRGVLFVVTELEMKFRAPARYGELIEVGTELLSEGPASIVFGHAIRREDAELVTGSTRLACLDGAGKVVRLPEEIRAVLHA